jgi:hypothetical protein
MWLGADEEICRQTNKQSWLWIPGSRLTARPGMTTIDKARREATLRRLRAVSAREARSTYDELISSTGQINPAASLP